MNRFCIIAGLVITLFTLSPAYAQDKPARRSYAKNKVRDRQKAMALFDESKARYREGKFEEAAQLLERAYALDPAPTLLYNLARALESSGDEDAAAQAYRRYLVVAPRTKDRAAIKKRIQTLEARAAERRELKRQLAQQRPPPEPQPKREPVSTAPASPPPEIAANAAPDPSIAPWLVTGGGVAAVGAGAILGIMAQSRRDDAQNAASQRDTAKLDDEAQGLALGANIAFIAGGALATGGLVWGLIELFETKPAADGNNLAWSPILGPNHLGLVGRF